LECDGTVRHLFIDFKKAYDSVREEVLYSVVTEFGIPRKVGGLIKRCLSKTCSTMCITKDLSDKYFFSRMA
jgi:hypothetical protein